MDYVFGEEETVEFTAGRSFFPKSDKIRQLPRTDGHKTRTYVRLL